MPKLNDILDELQKEANQIKKRIKNSNSHGEFLEAVTELNLIEIRTTLMISILTRAATEKMKSL